jgi:hypothetical protein
MNILEQLGIAFIILSILIVISLLSWLIYEISKCPKIWWLEFYYSLKYVCYEIKDFIYQNPKTNKASNPQNDFVTKTITNFDLILAQFNQAINAESQSNQSYYKMKYSKPRFIGNSSIDKIKDGYNNPTDGRNNTDDKSNLNEAFGFHAPNSSTAKKDDSTKIELYQNN